MADFITSILLVEKFEGGYTNNPKDKGNYYPQALTGTLIGTNRGITPTTYKEFYGAIPTVAQMKALTLQQARDIYKALYWNKIKGDSIKDQQLANIMMDSAVNEGVGTSINYAKKVLNLKTTSVMDTDTVTKINNANPKSLFTNIKDLRAAHYKAIGGTFYEGWMKRLNTFNYIGGTIAIGLIITIGVILYIGYRKRKELGKFSADAIKATL